MSNNMLSDKVDKTGNRSQKNGCIEQDWAVCSTDAASQLAKEINECNRLEIILV